jgi:hypothetical protein
MYFRLFFNISAYIKSELQVLKTVHVYDIDIVACWCEFSSNLAPRAKIQTSLCGSHVHPLSCESFSNYIKCK